jgi:hypothetical protein
MHCPHCGQDIADGTIRSYLNAKAGKAGKGASKARSSEQARAAINARWDRVRAQKEKAGN